MGQRSRGAAREAQRAGDPSCDEGREASRKARGVAAIAPVGDASPRRGVEAAAGDERVKPFAAAFAVLLSAAAPAPTYDWQLTPAGWGPVRIGMNRDQVAKALKTELQGDAFDNEGSCIELFPTSDALKGTYFMFLDGKLSRISVVETATIATPRGIHVGSTAD